MASNLIFDLGAPYVLFLYCKYSLKNEKCMIEETFLDFLVLKLFFFVDLHYIERETM